MGEGEGGGEGVDRVGATVCVRVRMSEKQVRGKKKRSHGFAERIMHVILILTLTLAAG